MSTSTSPAVVANADEPTGATRSERVALWVFVAYLAAAVPLLLWIGSYRWFLGDEWSFLADRSVSLGDLFRDHNQHWVTLPVLAFRGLYSLFGVRTYVPYQLLVIALHLTLVALLRVVMRRSGVGPWTASIVAGSFVLFGAAEDNILWAFQIGFVGALVFGLVQVILADHDGDIDRRDWLGLVAGAAALMSTGQALALIFAAGLVCVIRRHWRAAVFHTVPLALIYLTWFQLADTNPVVGIEGKPFTVRVYLEWMADAAVGLFLALGQFTILAVVLALLLVSGLAVAARDEGIGPFSARAAVPLALVAAGLLAMSLAAPSRFFLGEHPARAGRFIGVMAAMTLPALAVAIDALGRRWRPVQAMAVAAVLIAAPFNAISFGDDPYLSRDYYARQRNYVTALPELPEARAVPPWVVPNATILGQPDMSIGWLVAASDRGELPSPGQLDSRATQTAVIQLGVAAVGDEPPEGLTCADEVRLALDPSTGERLVFETQVDVASRTDDGSVSRGVQFEPSVVEITLPDLHLLLTPPSGSDQFRICR